MGSVRQIRIFEKQGEFVPDSEPTLAQVFPAFRFERSARRSDAMLLEELVSELLSDLIRTLLIKKVFRGVRRKLLNRRGQRKEINSAPKTAKKANPR